MMALAGTFAVYMAAGIALMRRKRLAGKEQRAFIVLSVIGFVLWGSIVLQVPLDLNQAIARTIDYIFK